MDGPLLSRCSVNSRAVGQKIIPFSLPLRNYEWNFILIFHYLLLFRFVSR